MTDHNQKSRPMSDKMPERIWCATTYNYKNHGTWGVHDTNRRDNKVRTEYIRADLAQPSDMTLPEGARSVFVSRHFGEEDENGRCKPIDKYMVVFEMLDKEAADNYRAAALAAIEKIGGSNE